MSTSRWQKSLLLLLVFWAWMGALSSAAEPLHVIVPSDWKTQQISIKKSDLKDLFLGKRKFLGADSRVVLGIDFRDKKTYQRLVSKVTGLETKAYESLWRKKLFSGSAIPPRKIRSHAALIEFLNEGTDRLVITFRPIVELPELYQLRSISGTVSKN